MPWKEENYFLSTAYIENVYRVLEQMGINSEIADRQGEPGTSLGSCFFDRRFCRKTINFLYNINKLNELRAKNS
jgi:hypothetical protein